MVLGKKLNESLVLLVRLKFFLIKKLHQFESVFDSPLQSG